MEKTATRRGGTCFYGSKKHVSCQQHPAETKGDLLNKLSSLQAEVASKQELLNDLEREVYRLRLQRDILEKAGQVLKKDQGISLTALTNREKTIVIDALRGKYRLCELLSELCIAKAVIVTNPLPCAEKTSIPMLGRE